MLPPRVRITTRPPRWPRWSTGARTGILLFMGAVTDYLAPAGELLLPNYAHGAGRPGAAFGLNRLRELMERSSGA